MTRETKIGLLVGLAFIIVIGILLSDHLTSSTEPPQAALAGAGNNVRQAVANPGQVAPQLPPAQVPTNTAPTQMVPTRDELTPGPNPTTIVKIGPAANREPTRVVSNTTRTAPNDQPQQQVQPGSEVANNDSPKITRVPSGGNLMNDLAKQHGEELVLVDGNGRAIHGKLSPRSSNAEYKAQAGDSLSKMAQRLMGANTSKNRDAIMAANPSMKNDPNKVIVGKTYLIPPASDAPTTPTAQLQQDTTDPTPQQPTTPTETAENWYTVKAGDSLWKIATEQCGRAGAVAALKELNQDLLVGDGKDQVVAGTKIRLPNKVVAKAN